MGVFSKPFGQSPFLLLAVLFVLCAGAWFFFSTSSRPVFSVDSIENCRDVNRESYSISPSVFSDLPPVPKCFGSVVSAFRDNSFSDISFFDSSYYLQPEFFPNFLSEGLHVWQSPDYTHYGAVGFGSYPSFSTVSSSQKSSTRFFIFSGFGVRSIQSVSLRWSFENPSDANYFSVSLDDSSSRDFLLGPTFPKFHSTWVRPVTLTIAPRDPGVVRPAFLTIHTVRSSADFSLHPLTAVYPFFDSTDYVGEKVVYQVTLSD